MTTSANLATAPSEVSYLTLANKYYDSSSKVANTNEHVALTLSARIGAFFDAWTNASYDAWEKSGRTEQL